MLLDGCGMRTRQEDPPARRGSARALRDRAIDREDRRVDERCRRCGENELRRCDLLDRTVSPGECALALVLDRPLTRDSSSESVSLRVTRLDERFTVNTARAEVTSPAPGGGSGERTWSWSRRSRPHRCGGHDGTEPGADIDRDDATAGWKGERGGSTDRGRDAGHVDRVDTSDRIRVSLSVSSRIDSAAEEADAALLTRMSRPPSCWMAEATSAATSD
jgi:hypothetical protein